MLRNATIKTSLLTFVLPNNQKIAFTVLGFTDEDKDNGESAEDFPKFPVIEGAGSVTLPSTVLSSAVASTVFSIGTDELRPAMTRCATESRHD